MSERLEALKRFEIPGRVSVLEGHGGLVKLEVTAVGSSAEIYLHGAHVTDFRRRGEAPLLFMSQCSRFAPGQPIRGGVPIIFPWFGPREGSTAHGFARTVEWQLLETVALPDGGATLRFGFPAGPESSLWPSFTAYYVVTVAESLSLELVLTNTSPAAELSIENCLHTYFTVGDIGAVSVRGLKGVEYLDKVENFARKTEGGDAITVTGEVDRVYLGTTGAVEICDASLKRRIIVEKRGSASTVVWNPWIAKAQQMADFANDEYLRMICVESGNVAANKLELAPGKSSALKVNLSAKPL